jgi:type II secretory pathway predicted ATPase ExeA
LTEDRVEALSRLLFAAEHRRPFAVLSGPAGVGKTRLLGELQQQLERAARIVVRIDTGGLGRHELPEALATASHTASDTNRPWRVVEDLVTGQGLAGDGGVWIVDHVDHAADDLAPELERFAHLLARSDVRGTLILATSDLHRLGPLADRADWPIALGRWTLEDTAAAIELATRSSVGWRFSREALRLIAEHAHGRPAATLRLCELAVLAAELQDANAIDADLVREVLQQRAPVSDDSGHRPGSADDALVSVWRD